MEPYQPQHGHPDASGIAQQYSSATLVSLRFLSRKEKPKVRSKNLMSSNFSCFKFSPKFGNFKLR
jgi:hypothetical protein